MRAAIAFAAVFFVGWCVASFTGARRADDVFRTHHRSSSLDRMATNLHACRAQRFECESDRLACIDALNRCRADLPVD